MDFWCTSPDAIHALESFRRTLTSSSDPCISAISAKLADLPGRMIVVAGGTPSAPPAGELGLPERWNEVVQAFRVVCCAESDDDRRESGWQVIEDFGEPFGMGCRVGSASWSDRPSYPCRSLMWKVRGKSGEPEYFYLVFPGSRTPISTFDMGLLVDLAQIEMGRLPIHAASVLFRGRLFLFLGESGAGKSTVSEFVKAEGGLVLDDDQFLVEACADGRWTGQGWGKALTQSPLPVSAVTVLVKAEEDALTPIPQWAVARMLVESSLQCSGYRLWKSQLKEIFRVSAGLARTVPGFSLQFTKSPAFLSLLCEQVPPSERWVI